MHKNLLKILSIRRSHLQFFDWFKDMIIDDPIFELLIDSKLPFSKIGLCRTKFFEHLPVEHNIIELLILPQKTNRRFIRDTAFAEVSRLPKCRRRRCYKLFFLFKDFFWKKQNIRPQRFIETIQQVKLPWTKISDLSGMSMTWVSLSQESRNLIQWFSVVSLFALAGQWTD